MILNCLVVDDEAAGRRAIEDQVRATDFLYLVASLSHPSKAEAYLKEHEIHLLFLDVQMPRISGIEFLRSLENPPLTILVSGHSEYALQGFELEVIDYLLKPISAERFTKAVTRAREFFELKNASGPETRTHFFIRCNNQYERVNFADLLFVEADNNHVNLQTRDKRLTTYLTFKSATEHLPADRFIKVHKSFVVAADKIESIDGEKLRIGEHRIPISRAMRASVLEQVLRNNVIRK